MALRRFTIRIAFCLFLLGMGSLWLASCAPQAAAPTSDVKQQTGLPAVEEAPASTEAPAAPPTPTAASAPLPTLAAAGPVGTVAPQAPAATEVPAATAAPEILPEPHMVEIEWPGSIRLGDSDVVRLSLIPAEDGYTLTTEFPEHQAQSQTVYVPRPGGYDLYGVARLDGVGFSITPVDEQAIYLPPGEPATWRWSLTPRQPGQQRLSVMLKLRWTPVATGGTQREGMIYSQTLHVQVLSFLGMSRGQAMSAAFLGLIFGGGLGLASLTIRPRRENHVVHPAHPNSRLQIEPRAEMTLSVQEKTLLQTLFNRYTRLELESEFHSGYSGARTFLALPVRQDGRADAYTIAKLGSRADIQQEYENYEAFVKDTLPPMTARIQHPPVVASHFTGGYPTPQSVAGLAALQYTFIGEPGATPTSLRQALLLKPDPAYLRKLFETFAPNWWMQRQPYTFRLGQEYDCMLPPHLIVEPINGVGARIDERMSPGALRLQMGEFVNLGKFSLIERRGDGALSLIGEAQPGQPPLRIRWLGSELPNRTSGRVVATRRDVLQTAVAEFTLYGLPDPLDRLPALLEETVLGGKSVIHGDLNVENALVGPGGMIWLIDFARTREGHPFFDFAHLEAEIIAHVLAPCITEPLDFLALLAGKPKPEDVELLTLLECLHELAGRCLRDVSRSRERRLAQAVACLGAIKHSNLDQHARFCLYLASAHFCKEL